MLLSVSSATRENLPQSQALRQKTALCVVPAPEGLGACSERELRLLRMGIPTPPSECSACRTFVGDAVIMLRRSRQTPDKLESPEFRRAARLLDDLCDDLDMRHFPPAGTPASALYEGCSQLFRRNYDLRVVRPRTLIACDVSWPAEWTYTDVEHFVCSRMLGLCMKEDQAEEAALQQAQAAVAAPEDAERREDSVSSGHRRVLVRMPTRHYVPHDHLKEQEAFTNELEKAELAMQRNRQREL
ncbi:MAG: hypothetical protein SGPRY_008101 [Prymnesium sp.]